MIERLLQQVGGSATTSDILEKRRNTMKSLLLFFVFALCVSGYDQSISGASPRSRKAESETDKANGPQCSESWADPMTFATMKNAKLVTNDEINFEKTKSDRIASQKIGKGLWHQVYHITYTKKSGETIEAITVHDASSEECSMTAVEVYVVSKHLSSE